jgi:hypothetical protein
MGSSESIKMPRKLQILVDRKKRKAVDSYFQAIRNKVGKDTSVVMLYGNDCFPPWSKHEDSASTGKFGPINTRRGGIAKRKGKKQPYDLLKAKCSLRRATASGAKSRGQNTLPLHGPGATARQG